MIVAVDETNLFQAAVIHSISWKESHRSFCAPDFIEMHTPERQQEYIRKKRLYLAASDLHSGAAVDDVITRYHFSSGEDFDQQFLQEFGSKHGAQG